MPLAAIMEDIHGLCLHHTLKTAVELTFVIYLSLELSPINVCHYFIFSITHVARLKKFTEGSL